MESTRVSLNPKHFLLILLATWLLKVFILKDNSNDMLESKIEDNIINRSTNSQSSIGNKLLINEVRSKTFIKTDEDFNLYRSFTLFLVNYTIVFSLIIIKYNFGTYISEDAFNWIEALRIIISYSWGFINFIIFVTNKFIRREINLWWKEKKPNNFQTSLNH